MCCSRRVEEAEGEEANGSAGAADHPDLAPADLFDVKRTGEDAGDEDETGAAGGDERAGGRVETGLLKQKRGVEEYLRAECGQTRLEVRKSAVTGQRTKSIPLSCWKHWRMHPSVVRPRTPGAQMSLSAAI